MKQLMDKYGDIKESFEEEFLERAGLLFHVNWYRVILDEAHKIKGRDNTSKSSSSHRESKLMAQAANACWHLRAKYRWAVSGTPLSNSPDGISPTESLVSRKLTHSELFPYLRFLRCDFTYEYSDYKQNYIKHVSLRVSSLGSTSFWHLNLLIVGELCGEHENTRFEDHDSKVRRIMMPICKPN